MLKALLTTWLLFPFCILMLAGVQLWARKLGVKWPTTR